MITLRTGLPGSGKTLRAVSKGIEEVGKGREVYELGINGVNHEVTGIKPAPFDSLEDWQDLPQGSLLIVDEVQRWLKLRPTGSATPDWIEAFTRNRHLGVDLLFITQDALLIDAYVRRLVNYHEHLVRLEGNFPKARVYWSEGLMTIKDNKPPKSAAFELWSYPEQNYALYKSAAEHTVKKYVPQRLKFAAFGAVALVVLIGIAVYALRGMGQSDKGDQPAEVKPVVKSLPVQQQPVTAPRRLLSPGREIGGRATWTNAVEYVEAHTPVIEGQPWTAPVFSQQQPTTSPEIYCISSPNSCTCLSEQGTRIIVRDAVCRTIAREGSYNPYRRDSQGSRSGVEMRRGSL